MREHSKFVKEQFEKDAETYDAEINDIVPYYEEIQREVLLISDIFNFSENEKLIVLDLGIGTGNPSINLLRKYKDMEIDAIDLSPKMIQVAKNHLSEFSNRINFIEEDMIEFNPKRKYNACVGLFSVHHLNQEQKKELFKKIFNCLENKGIFIIGDLVVGDTPEETKELEEEWKNYLIKKAGKEGIKWYNVYKKEDIPDSINNQIKWLKEAGFKTAELKWKKMNFVVLFGKK